MSNTNEIRKLKQENARLKKALSELRTAIVRKGETVNTPPEVKPIFDVAQKTVGEYFSKTEFRPEEASIIISGERYLLVRASALSDGFFESFTKLYKRKGDSETAHIVSNILFDISHLIGMEDAKNFHRKMKLKDPISKLSAGPVHFAYTGWAFVDILPESRPVGDENYFLKYHHPFSFEADSWIKKGKRSKTPVCIMNAGYSSGWCEQSFGMSLTAVEISCRARGDKHCTFIMAPPHKIEQYLGQEKTKIPKSQLRIPAFLQRKKTEDQLKKSLDEKETLIKEVHHRVKNNLQIVSSLLNLQSESLPDETSRAKIKESIGRIKSMALVHELLYQSKDLSKISVKSYFTSLIQHIHASFSNHKNIKLVTNIRLKQTEMSIDIAIPLGLLINETLSNSFKYAFGKEKKGQIKVILSDLKTGKKQLIIEDNGRGIGKDQDMFKAETLGFQLIHSLVAQLEGSIKLDTSKGTRFEIEF